MPAVCLALLTTIALNAQLSGTVYAARSLKKHAQQSLWFAVGAAPTVVERTAAAEHSLFVLYLDRCCEPKSLPDQQLHLSELLTRTSDELFRADCDELF